MAGARRGDPGTRLSGVRGDRYGEVFLVRAEGDELAAEVYNSYTLGDCPAEAWSRLDAAAIAAEHGAVAAVLNGPRFWAMDSIEKAPPAEPRVESFGGIVMVRVATLHLGAAALDRSPYVERHVARGTVFSFDAGGTVYELHSRDGATYVMQSWSCAADTSLTEADLPGLGARLQLPEGWRYTARRLDEPLDVVTTAEDAVVLQDDLLNTYSRLR